MGLKETESNRVSIAVGSVIDHRVVNVLEPYDVYKKLKPQRRNVLKEWSVAPSIFNIKTRGLAHCLHWMKLSQYEQYVVYFHGSMALSDDRL